jgi:uncharacterized membrane protein
VDNRIFTFVILEMIRFFWRKELSKHERWGNALLVAELSTLIVLSGMTGAALTAHFQRGKRHVPINTSLFLAAASVQREPGSDTVIATHEEKIIELKEEDQQSKDDRKLLHDQVAKVGTTENDHYNALNDRLNVDEARVSTTLWVVGIFFTFTQGLVVFFNIAERFERRSAEQRKGQGQISGARG